jgi:hypothetical protein
LHTLPITLEKLLRGECVENSVAVHCYHMFANAEFLNSDLSEVDTRYW